MRKETKALKLYEHQDYASCLEELYKTKPKVRVLIWSLIILSYILSGLSFYLSYLGYTECSAVVVAVVVGAGVGAVAGAVAGAVVGAVVAGAVAGVVAGAVVGAVVVGAVVGAVVGVVIGIALIKAICKWALSKELKSKGERK